MTPETKAALLKAAVEHLHSRMHKNIAPDETGAWVSADAGDWWKETGMLNIDGYVDVGELVSLIVDAYEKEADR